MTARWPFDPLRAGASPFASCVQLDPRSTVLFLSDLHFGDGSATDLFGEQDGRLIDFLEEERGATDTFVFLGDILDMPQAWSLARIGAAHADLLAYLRELGRGHDVIFVRGNHDWTVPYDELFPGARRCEAVRLGERVLAWHGHQVDLLMHPGARRFTAKMYAHAALERIVRQRLVPPLELHDSIANRVGLSIAVLLERLRWARAHRLRAAGAADRADTLEAQVRYLARSVLGDPADLFGATCRHVHSLGYDVVACGHTHQPGVIEAPTGTYVNTGTWTYGMRTCAVWSSERFEVRDLDSGRAIGDERYRTIPAETRPRELFDWWRREIATPAISRLRGP